MDSILEHGTGWLPETYSSDDLHHNHDAIHPVLSERGVHDFIEERKALPVSADLRQWAPPVHFQGGYNTCAAHVVACLLEFFENKVG